MADQRTLRSPAVPQARQARVAAVAASQRDLFTLEQAVDCGLSPRAVQQRVARGLWNRVHRGVYTVSHAPLSDDARRLAAVLTRPAALLSYRSAAALWGILPDDTVMHITVPVTAGTLGGPAGVRLHRARDLAASDRSSHRGIPVTSIPRTLIDLALSEPAGVLEQAVHEAEVRRLLRRDDVRARVPAGRPGSARLSSALGMPLGDPTNSRFVRTFLGVCSRHGLPRPETAVYLDAGLGHLTELDVLFRDARVVVELDGEQTHATRRRFHHDRRRDAALAALGYLTLRYTWQRVTQEGAAVADEIRKVLALRS